VAWEVIFVDDNSPDATWDVVRDLARQDSRVPLSAKGSGGAGCPAPAIEGILASSAPFAAVMDADLQHDEDAIAEDALAVAEAGRRNWWSAAPLYRRRQR